MALSSLSATAPIARDPVQAGTALPGGVHRGRGRRGHGAPAAAAAAATQPVAAAATSATTAGKVLNKLL